MKNWDKIKKKSKCKSQEVSLDIQGVQIYYIFINAITFVLFDFINFFFFYSYCYTTELQFYEKNIRYIRIFILKKKLKVINRIKVIVLLILFVK